MAEKRHRISGILTKKHLTLCVEAWLRFAKEAGYYPEEIVNEAIEKVNGDGDGKI